MMKKLQFILFVLSILIVSSLNGFAVTPGSSPQISVTLYSQSPDPVEPGQIVTLKFKVENEGKETTQDVILKLHPNFPFTLYGSSAEKNIGKLRASSTGADAEIVEFKVKVDENAVEGDTEIELLVQIGESAIAYTNNELMVTIQTHDAVLDITSISSNPKQIAPGQDAKVSIMVKNQADSVLKDVKFKLDFDSDTLPLAPYQSSSERRIALLKSGYQNSLEFQIIADPEAAPGLYKVPLTITYNDELGTSYSVSDVLALTVGEVPNLNVYLKKSTVLQSGMAGKVTIEIANAGGSDVKYLELKLLPSEYYTLVSTSDYFYLGDIDADDTGSEDVDIFINKNVETLKIPVLIKYYDANNKPFQQTLDLQMYLYSSSELKKFGVLQSSNSWMYLLIIILAIGGYVYYKRFYKKKKK